MATTSAILISPVTAESVAAARAHVQSALTMNRRMLAELSSTDAPPPIRRLGIIGAGQMGAAIAAATIKHGIAVLVTDLSADALAGFHAVVSRVLQADSGVCGSTAGVDPGRWIETTTEPAALRDCDLVIECVVEIMETKQALFRAIEPHLSGVLLSNTSTLPMARLCAALQQPQRLCGTHFFLPLAERRLVEIIRGPRTEPAALAQAIAYVAAIGKIPLVVNDGPGFLVNRLFMVYASEAMCLLLEGADPATVDQVGFEFGMGLGPLSLLDVTGIDVALNCGWVFAGAYPDVLPRTPLLVALRKAGRLGCKTGAGFWRYEQAGDRAISHRDPELDAIIARWSQTPRPHTRESIAARIFLPMLLEATRILRDGIVTEPGLVDLGGIFGLGFPESRGGLFHWADTIGAARIVELLDEMKYVGERIAPTSLLLELAARGGRFCDPA